jgi:hypothetical protein
MREKKLVQCPSKEAKKFVVAHFGKWADRVLEEGEDPRFLNPIIGVSVLDNEVICNRRREYWHNGCTTSLSNPEPGSLTKEYAKGGSIIKSKTAARSLTQNPFIPPLLTAPWL